MRHVLCCEQAYYEKNQSLEVRLRPEDKFCKPAQARSVPVTNLVLRVRRRRRRVSEGEGPVEGDGSQASVCNVEVLGLVKQNFEFTGRFSRCTLLGIAYTLCNTCTCCANCRYG